MTGKKLDAQFAYTRPELRKVPRLFLMLYLEERYQVPRSKAGAEKGYEGPYTALIKEESVLLDLIWEKYQEEGIAGAKALKKAAPRPPTGEAPEEPEPEPKQEVEVPIDTSPPEEEATKQAPEPEPAQKKAKKTRSRKPKATVDIAAIGDLLQEQLAPLYNNVAALAEGQALGSDERKAIYDMVSNVLEEADRLTTVLRNALVLLGGLVGDIRGLDFGITDEVLEEAFVLGMRLTDQEKVEEQPEGKPEKQKTNGKATTKSVQEDEGATYNVEIDGETHKVSILSLQDEKRFPSALLAQLGSALGIEVRGMPRVRSVPLIWDELTTQANA